MNQNKCFQTNDLSIKNNLIRPKIKKTVILWVITALVFFIGVSNQYGQLCVSSSVYDDLSWTWTYAGPCSTSYNCLAYAIDITNQWIWPWGSNATSSQVTTYLDSVGFYKYGYNARVISYGPSSNSISHFSKVTGASTCRAKCGSLNLLDHGSWNPYYSGSSYGSKQQVYYAPRRSMQVSIDGPTIMEYAGFFHWSVNVLYANTPCSYEWHFSGAEYDYELMSTSSFVDFVGIFNDDVFIDVEVTDSLGYQGFDSILVTVGYFGAEGGFFSKSHQAFSIKEHISDNLSNLLSEAVKRNINSSNPYDYIDSDYFREIVRMGPVALMTIRKMILTSNENGLKEYILAIASEKIARFNLKGNSFSWTTAKEYCREWEKHMRTLSSKITDIINSDLSIENKNDAIIKLGIPSIPYLIDEIENGKNEFGVALKTLLRGLYSGKEELDETLETLKEKNQGDIKILRKLADSYRRK